MRAILLSLLAMTLAACASVKTLEVADDVRAFLISIRDNDQAAFDTHVDRPALKRQIEKKLAAEAGQDERLSGLAAILTPALAELADEALIQPAVFRRVAEYYGYRPETKIPGPLAISQVLKPLPDGGVCATRGKNGPCLLTFTKGSDGRWRLSGFDGELAELRLRR